ncbi:hypothetical protein RUM43_005682 [Polyplax serrata]|uniref:Serine/threonine-protein phosphatase n=1 Tax=Polyplax serrata TaxID=468196 RepID=A0AAN8PBJ1_POLSC
MFLNKKDLTNVLSVLVYCSQDNTFLLLQDGERGDYWIPSTKMDDKFSWRDNLRFFKQKLFDYEIINEKLLKIVKIWSLEKDYFHLIFQVSLPKEVKTNCKTQTQLGTVGWYTCSQILKLKSQLRSLEILEATHNYLSKIHRYTQNVTGEVLPMGSLTEVREDDILLTPENCQNKKYLDLLDSAGIPVEEQYELYEDYFLHTYPCIYMNPIAFKRCISKFKFTSNPTSLFRAADVWEREFLTFQDYLLLVAIMQPYTGHYGHSAEIRCQYIFRYFNENKDGKMNYHELTNFVTDLQLAKNMGADRMEVNKEIELLCKVLEFKTNSTMTFDQFYSFVLQSKIQDTTLLLRFSENQGSVTLSDNVKDLMQVNVLPNKLILPTDSQGRGSDSDYRLLLKTTLLKPGDDPLEIKDLRFLEDTMTKSVTEDFRILSTILNFHKDSYNLDVKINELLLALKYFCTEICQSPIFCGEFEFEEKEAYSWGSAYLEKLGITLIMMCEQLKEIFSQEPRLLRLSSPVYIMGDLHGNYRDLMRFEKALWNNGIPFLPAKLLFLGDYVDRGTSGLEVLMYLFANKIQNSNKLYLVRGNHEIRDIQKLFTFQRECMYKLGSTLGMSVWKAVNEVFDTMPLAAVVDNKIFCCHGGIPPPWLCPVVSVIDSIPCPLVNCEKQSPLAWALMWNDPLKNTVRNSVQESELIANEGFVPNIQRGTAYAFSCDALNRFLKTNNLSHVVRAHEVVKAGFQIHQKGRLLTVFSSSGYCGGKNYAAGVLVADHLLRVFMVDTGIN